MIYDVHAKQESMTAMLQRLLEQVKTDEVSGVIIISMKKDGSLYFNHRLDGDEILPWIGGLEVVKAHLTEGSLYD